MRLLPALALLSFLSACGDDTTPNTPDAAAVIDADPTAIDAFIPGADPNEPNNDLATATDVVLGTPISGALGSTSDYDCFKISGVAADQVIVARVMDGATSACGDDTLDSFIDLRDSSNTLLGQDDDKGLNMCSRITYRVTTAGDYYVCFRLPEDVYTLYDYSLLVRLVTPTITVESEPNYDDTVANAFTPADGAMLTGEASLPYPPPDKDTIAFTIAATTHYRIETVGEGTSNCGLVGTSIDNTIDLFDSSGSNRLLQDSDNGLYYCSAFEYDFTPGTYYISTWPASLVTAADLPFSYGVLFLAE